jgi:thioredoxin-dependent peroxiredoxin
MIQANSNAHFRHVARKTEARFVLLRILAYSILFCGVRTFAEPPAVGTAAPDFTLKTPQGASVQLSKLSPGHTAVLVMLRGFPGYQCPYCQKQVHDFVIHASDFAAKDTSVLLVYPGAPGDLGERAKDFLAKENQLPPNIVLVTDPDFAVTNLYGLRWNEPGETAYPSTFILAQDGRIVFSKISRSHGDRLSAQEALDHLPSR